MIFYITQSFLSKNPDLPTAGRMCCGNLMGRALSISLPVLFASPVEITYAKHQSPMWKMRKLNSVWETPCFCTSRLESLPDLAPKLCWMCRNCWNRWKFRTPGTSQPPQRSLKLTSRIRSQDSSTRLKHPQKCGIWWAWHKRWRFWVCTNESQKLIQKSKDPLQNLTCWLHPVDEKNKHSSTEELLTKRYHRHSWTRLGALGAPAFATLPPSFEAQFSPDTFEKPDCGCQSRWFRMVRFIEKKIEWVQKSSFAFLFFTSFLISCTSQHPGCRLFPWPSSLQRTKICLFCMRKH